MRQQYHFRKVGEDVHIWDVNKLIDVTSDIVPEEVPLDTIKEIDEEYWYSIGGAKPTCRDLANHFDLIQAADLKYPILLCHQGRVIDGMHRVCKALSLGYSSILAKRLKMEIEPDFVNVDAKNLKY